MILLSQHKINGLIRIKKFKKIMGQSGLEMGQHIFAKILTKNVCTFKSEVSFFITFSRKQKTYFFYTKNTKTKMFVPSQMWTHHLILGHQNSSWVKMEFFPLQNVIGKRSHVENIFPFHCMPFLSREAKNLTVLGRKNPKSLS